MHDRREKPVFFLLLLLSVCMCGCTSLIHLLSQVAFLILPQQSGRPLGIQEEFIYLLDVRNRNAHVPYTSRHESEDRESSRVQEKIRRHERVQKRSKEQNTTKRTRL
jgi:hypothetical protein